MNKDNNQLNNLRHSAAHLLAAAVLDLYPNAKRTIGPAIENGFYFDFDFGDEKVSEDDLPRIEKKMHELSKKWFKFERHELSAEEAKKEYPGNEYKHELIDEIEEKGAGPITFYKSGEYWDLCEGGHTDNPQDELKYFKLLNIAGAYWRGSEKNKMLTRIYGTAFPTQEELDNHLKMREEAEKRNHRKIGQELELFMFHETSPGMPYWLPNGVILYNELLDFWRKEHKERGYKEIVSPLANKKELYVTSGHFEHYWEDMFHFETEEGEEYALKAMNCPNAMLVYGSKTRSYRDLPLRFSDVDTLHRNELSGTLNGLFRVREFKQDDAHCYVSEDQVAEEFEAIFKIVDRFYSIFNMSYKFRLGTRPESFMGDEKTWDKAEQDLKEILDKSGREYFVGEGEGAFYGPKVDILMKDALGREWQMGTIQLDFQMPKRFNLEYIDSQGQAKTPVVIHRVVYGSLERFVGILIEHYGGAFPAWLAPVQAAILPISDKTLDYAKKVQEKLENAGMRVEVDSRSETLQAKIRDAQLKKVPYMLILGGREEENGTVALRLRDGRDLGAINLDEFIGQATRAIEEKLELW